MEYIHVMGLMVRKVPADIVVFETAVSVSRALTTTTTTTKTTTTATSNSGQGSPQVRLLI